MTTVCAPAVRLRLLDGFELRVDGDLVDVKPAGARLLALLALADAAVTRNFAACQLWPDASLERAQANLRSTVWRLRDMPGALLTATKTHIRLAAHVWVDVREGLREAQRADPDAPLDTVQWEAKLL